MRGARIGIPPDCALEVPGSLGCRGRSGLSWRTAIRWLRDGTTTETVAAAPHSCSPPTPQSLSGSERGSDRSSPLHACALDRGERVCWDLSAQAAERSSANPLVLLRGQGSKSHQALHLGTQHREPAQRQRPSVRVPAPRTAGLPQVSGIPHYGSLSTWPGRTEFAPTRPLPTGIQGTRAEPAQSEKETKSVATTA